MGIFADVWRFVEEVALNWRTGIAIVVFLLFSFPNAVLSDNYKSSLEKWFPIENRRKVLVVVAVIYIVIACFLAWEEAQESLQGGKFSLSPESGLDCDCASPRPPRARQTALRALEFPIVARHELLSGISQKCIVIKLSSDNSR